MTTGQEAEVGHVVGLVEHGDLDGVEGDEALLHEVFEAAGAGDDDVDAGLERGDLAVLARRRRRSWWSSGRRPSASGSSTAVIWVASSRVGASIEAERAARAAVAAGELAAEARDHRDGEREGLAGAGLAAAEHVAPGEGVGQGVDLDRERRSVLPSAARTATRGAGTPSVPKVISDIKVVWCLSGIGCPAARMRARESRWRRWRWPHPFAGESVYEPSRF